MKHYSEKCKILDIYGNKKKKIFLFLLSFFIMVFIFGCCYHAHYPNYYGIWTTPDNLVKVDNSTFDLQIKFISAQMDFWYKSKEKIPDTCFCIRNLPKPPNGVTPQECNYKIRKTSQSHYSQDMNPYKFYLSDTSIAVIDSQWCMDGYENKCLSKIIRIRIKADGKAVLISESNDYSTGVLFTINNNTISKIDLMNEKVYTDKSLRPCFF